MVKFGHLKKTILGVTVQVILGMFSAPIFPSLLGSYYWWGVPSEITTLVAFLEAGVGLGCCLGVVITGFIINYWYWEAAFYSIGIIMLVITTLWILLADKRPENSETSTSSNFLPELSTLF